MEKKSYPCIDIFKIIMAIFVVAIHTNPLVGFGNVERLETVFRLAVPFFFISSGFLLGRKSGYNFSCEIDRNVLSIHLRKILRLYIIWSIIYLPLSVYNDIFRNCSIFQIFLAYLKGFFFFGEHYYSWMLWYTLCTVYSLAIFLIFRKKDKILFLVCLLLFVFSLILDGLITFEVENKIIDLIKLIIIKLFGTGRLFRGPLYIYLGFLFSKKFLGFSISVLMFIIGISLSTFLPQIHLFEICIMISSIGLFNIVIRIPVKQNIITVYCRKLSTGIYFSHMYFVFILEKVIRINSGLLLFFYSLWLSIFVSMFYYFIKTKRELLNRKVYADETKILKL